MRFKLGLITGFGAGYYMGAKAGRTRYEQMKRWLGQVKESEIAHDAVDKMKDAVDIRDHGNGLGGSETVAERVDLYVAADTTKAL